MLKAMGEEVQTIVSQVADQAIRKQVANELVKSVKELFDIDISRFVEKVPRALRVPKKGRKQTS